MALLDDIDRSRGDFVWKAAERLIAGGPSALASLPAFLRAAGIDHYVLMATDRSLAQAEDYASSAEEVILVPEGSVDKLASDLLERSRGLPIIAVGGGRVIDTAKAIAATDQRAVVAIPTTLSGAPMTRFHKLPAGYAGPTKLTRPRIVIAIPDYMAGQPRQLRTGSAMNALSHAIEAAFTMASSPVPRLIALRAVELLFRPLTDASLDEDERRRRLATGALMAGYAIGATGFAIHHVTCQTIVRLTDVAHAPTYGVVLPYTLELMKIRDELTWTAVAEAMGTDQPSIDIARVCAEAGLPASLSDHGVPVERFDAIATTAATRSELRMTPGGADADTVMALLQAAA